MVGNSGCAMMVDLEELLSSNSTPCKDHTLHAPNLQVVRDIWRSTAYPGLVVSLGYVVLIIHISNPSIRLGSGGLED